MTLNALANSIPPINSYSLARRITRQLLGPKARIWRTYFHGDDNRKVFKTYQIGYEDKKLKKRGDGTEFWETERSLLGEGADFTSAIKVVAFTLARAKAQLNHSEKLNGKGQPGEVSQAATSGEEPIRGDGDSVRNQEGNGIGEGNTQG